MQTRLKAHRWPMLWWIHSTAKIKKNLISIYSNVLDLTLFSMTTLAAQCNSCAFHEVDHRHSPVPPPTVELNSEETKQTEIFPFCFLPATHLCQSSPEIDSTYCSLLTRDLCCLQTQDWSGRKKVQTFDLKIQVKWNGKWGNRCVLLVSELLCCPLLSIKGPCLLRPLTQLSQIRASLILCELPICISKLRDQGKHSLWLHLFPTT